MSAKTLYREGQLGVRGICDQLGISKPTLYAYLNHRGVNTKSRRNPVSDKNSWRIT